MAAPGSAPGAVAARHDGSEEEAVRRRARAVHCGRHGGAQAASGELGSVASYHRRRRRHRPPSAVAALRGHVPAEAAPHHAAPGEGGGRDGGSDGAGRGERWGKGRLGPRGKSNLRVWPQLPVPLF